MPAFQIADVPRAYGLELTTADRRTDHDCQTGHVLSLVPRQWRPPGVQEIQGGQRKPRELRELILEIAKTTGFGYTRIIGELRKLGIRRISRQTGAQYSQGRGNWRHLPVNRVRRVACLSRCYDMSRHPSARNVVLARLSVAIKHQAVLRPVFGSVASNAEAQIACTSFHGEGRWATIPDGNW